MRLDRRQFIQLGAIATFAGSACKGSKEPDANAPGPAQSAVRSLKIGFEGLYLVERKGSSAVIHLFDAAAIHMAPHLAQMKALASTIDQTKTARPDAAHVIPAGGGDDFWLWDLNGLNVTTPASEKGTTDLETETSSSEDGQDIPSTDAGWHSMARVPDLKLVCGATRITKYDAFASSFALTHGHLGVLKPFAYSNAVWKFTKPGGQVLMRRALSNKVQYRCPTNGQALTLLVGTQAIVFKPGIDADVSVSNLPLKPPPPCPSPCTPNMDHFKAFCDVVDKAFEPVITLDSFTPVPLQDASSGYCPGGGI